MKRIYLILTALVLIQSSICYADTVDREEFISQELLSNEIDDIEVTEDKKKPAWMDMFTSTSTSLFPTSSATMMAQASLSDKSPEEQLEDIKEMANQINLLIQSEMANLLSYAIGFVDNGELKSRKRRSTETPMDSTEMVMRLLKHIKSNNEYQNIAIEKMMSAQEIADKYNIPFNPDTEILSELAKVANEQASEMTAILKDTCDITNSSQCANALEHNRTYSYMNVSQSIGADFNNTKEGQMSSIEFVPLDDYIDINRDQSNEAHLSHYDYYFTSPVETQIIPPPQQEHSQMPMSSRPSFYDTISYSPMPDYPYCTMEPIYNVPYFADSEPELVGEEYEETVSSKLFIDLDGPGSSTVNHVTTYTLSEKAHFKTPEIESLPQQMQYYFLLI